MKAIFIDVRNKSVDLIDMEGGLQAMYRQMECDLISCVHICANEDALYVDDEGLMRAEPIGAFFFRDFPYQPLYGHGLIQGTDSEGDSQDVASALEDIRAKVTFLDPSDDLTRRQQELLNKPIRIIT